MDEDSLPDPLFEKLTEVSEHGNDLMDDGRFDQAIEQWKIGIDLLPSPKHKWEAYSWLYASIGDAQRQSGHLDEALESFGVAYSTPTGHVNPFVMFSLGATLFDLGKRDEAKDPLLRAYMMEGSEIFEDENPEYLGYLERLGLLPKD